MLLGLLSETVVNSVTLVHWIAAGSTGDTGHYLEVLNLYAEAVLTENRENNCTYLFENCKLLCNGKVISAS